MIVNVLSFSIHVSIIFPAFPFNLGSKNLVKQRKLYISKISEKLKCFYYKQVESILGTYTLGVYLLF